jgi:hypothetical protein
VQQAIPKSPARSPRKGILVEWRCYDNGGRAKAYCAQGPTFKTYGSRLIVALSIALGTNVATISTLRYESKVTRGHRLLRQSQA